MNVFLYTQYIQDFQLLRASKEGDSAMVSALIEAGASLDIRSTDGVSNVRYRP